VTAVAEESPDTGTSADRGPRGRVWLYAVAFVLLLVSGYFQFSGAIGTGGLSVVWSSIGLSAAAVVVAAVAVMVPGKAEERGRRPVDTGTATAAQAEEGDGPEDDAGVTPAS
jgi:hypothetical protein